MSTRLKPPPRLHTRAFAAGLSASDRQAREALRPPQTAVLGVDGFLGRALWAAYRRWRPDTLGTTRRPASSNAADGAAPLAQLDLLAPTLDAESLAQAGYQAAILPAAMTSVAVCEREPQRAWQINVEGPLTIAEQLARAGLTAILFSSDYVFDGRTGHYDDGAPTRPLNQYGRSKAELERRLPEVCGDNWLVIRLSKVFSNTPGDNTLLDEMATKLRSCGELRVATDQVFCPTPVDEVVSAIVALQRAGARGIYNVCQPERWSRFDLAVAVAEAIGRDPSGVTAIRLADQGEPFARPLATDMVCRRLHAVTDFRFAPLADSLRRLTDPTLPHKEAA